MVPSSSEDVTLAMHGQPTRLLETTGDEMAEKLATSVFYTISRRFVRLGFRLNCARLAVHYFAVYSVLGNF